MTAIENKNQQHLAINYKTETESALGALPEGWSKMPYQNSDRFYFIHHPTQSTSWVDPRTKSVRKSNLHELQEFELPYGWEEIIDSTIGIYYADHITKKYYLQGPWTQEICKVATEDRAVFSLLKEKEKNTLKEADELKKLKTMVESQKQQEAQKTIQEMESVQLQLEFETQKRIQIEQQIMEMKHEILRLASIKSNERSDQVQETSQANDILQEECIRPQDTSESLEESLEEAKSLVERLEKISSWIETEKQKLSVQSSFIADEDESNYEIPSWLAHLDRKTIRQRIKQSLPNNPDELEFVQKVAKFEVEALDASEGPKLPSLTGLAFKNEFVIKPKETGYSDIAPLVSNS